VHIVAGSERNLKITYPQDLAVAEALLAQTAPGGGVGVSGGRPA